MGRVFFNTKENIHNLTASYTVLASDSGKTFIVLPAATTEITLPAPATAGEGWNCTIILQSDSGFGGDALMDQKVNIDMSSGTANVGLILAVDGDAGDQAVENDDFIACSANASPGDRFEFVTDGTRYYVHGLVADASETPFAAAAG
jgi:hypothetical protein|tara:strand:+ start:151 stop:591 length:441 start_codon:yes stop_codon:yes gene_type:complete